MGVYEGGSQLHKAMKELLRHWEETKVSWDDGVSKSFEQKYLVPLQADLRNAAGAVSQMAVLLDRIRRDCT